MKFFSKLESTYTWFHSRAQWNRRDRRNSFGSSALLLFFKKKNHRVRSWGEASSSFLCVFHSAVTANAFVEKTRSVDHSSLFLFVRWARVQKPIRLGSSQEGPRRKELVTWLILPVVICLSQRLSHACLSIRKLYCETANGSLNQL